MTALGVSLLIIGAIVVVAEAHLPSMGLLGGPGAVALASARYWRSADSAAGW